MLRRNILARILSAPSTSPIPSLHRLLSAAAPAVSPAPRFAVEDYLIDRCGLTRAQALKASTKLSHIKSPTNSDAVLAFLAGLGLSRADVAAVVSKDPLFLCAKVDTVLSPILVGLTGLGLSHSEIALLVSLVPGSFRCRSVVSTLPYYLSLFGSYENLRKVLRRCRTNILGSSLERVVKPNFAFLRECGLSACDIAKLCIVQRRLLTTKLEGVQAMVARAEAIGVPRGSGMIRQALQAVAFLSDEKIAAKVDYLKNMFRWSDAEVGLEPVDIAHRPVMLGLSLEGRLRPRYYVVRFLKDNGLLDRDRSYRSAVTVTEKVFVARYISPHNEAAPYLAEDYETACKGGVPARFRST